MTALVRRCAALALVLLTAAGLAAPASAADPDPSAGSDLVSFGIAPAGPERPDDRPYVAVTAPAGSVVYEHVALLNQGPEPVTLDVYGADVVMADGGGLSVRAASDTDTDAGAWVSVDAPGPVEVPAQDADGYGWTIVPLTVTVPQDAEPGDHVAGLVASLVTVADGAGESPGLQLEQRVAARVYVEVQGEVTPGLVVEDVRADWVPSGLVGAGETTVAWTVRNTGNVRLAVESSAVVSGPFGVRARHADGARVEELLPGGTARLTATVDGTLALGRQDVTVTAHAVAPATGRDPGLDPVVVTTHVWAVPWGPLAALGVLVLLLVLALRGRRRRPVGRRARQTGRGGRPARQGTHRAAVPQPGAVEDVPVHVGG